MFLIVVEEFRCIGISRAVRILWMDRLLAIATDVLRKNHLYHLQLAAALIQGPVATDEIEKLKSRYCTNINHAA